MTGLSIVVTGRNDDHGGDFARRLLGAARHNAGRLEEAGVDFEYLWIEWNPPPDRPLLAERIVRETPRSRAIVAGTDAHAASCDNPNMTIMEFFAKNAGIRRAKHDLVLTTNADVVLGDDVIAFVQGAEAARSAPVVYRAVRHDLGPGVEPHAATDPANWKFVFPTTAPYHTEASGDFLMARREVFHALGGFNETVRFAKLHKDSQFCIHAHKLGFRLEMIGSVFHIYHPNSWMYFPLTERETENAPWGRPYNYLANLPYLNPPNWGLADWTEAPLGEGVTRLVAPTGTQGATAPEAPSDVFAEAERLWRLARDGGDLDGFRAEYVAGLARGLRRQPDPAETSVRVLRRYARSVWEGLARDPGCRERGVAIYGAGRHTRWLLDVVKDATAPRINCILDDADNPGDGWNGVPIRKPESVDPESLGAIVLSSDIHEAKMAERCERLFGERARVVRLHDGLPTGLFMRDAAVW